MSTAQVVESSKQRWPPRAAAAASALSMTASTASTASSKTQRMHALTSTSTSSSSKNWRGKYLRALNISTPEVDVVSRKKHAPIVAPGGASTTSAALGTAQQRRMRGSRVDPNSRSVTFSRSFSTPTEREGDELQARVNRYQVSQAARYSSNGYGFAMKPDLARGRRCHTDPFVLDEDGDKTSDKTASAPIQIPSAAASSMDFRNIGGKLSDIDGATTINKNYSSKRYGSKSPVTNQSKNQSSSNTSNQDVTTGNLLSWEEPAVMMGGVAMNGSKPVGGGGGGAGLGGLDIAFSNVQINSSNNNHGIDMNSVSGGVGDAFCDEFVDTEGEEDRDEDGESLGDSESDSDDNDEIFEMEDFDSDSSLDINSSSDNNSKLHSSVNSSSSKIQPRRRRTASASQASPPPSSRRSAALPRHHSVRQMRANGTPSSPAMELPESFVPPHQMIQRDCFSIGLRDKFKRRPAKI